MRIRKPSLHSCDHLQSWKYKEELVRMGGGEGISNGEHLTEGIKGEGDGNNIYERALILFAQKWGHSLDNESPVPRNQESELHSTLLTWEETWIAPASMMWSIQWKLLML